MGYVNDQYAAMTRQAWQDYVANFVPYENKLIEYATDPNTVREAVSEARSDSTAAFDQAQLGTQQRLKGMGITLSADEQQAQTRQTGLARALTEVQAANTARDATLERQQSIVGIPSSLSKAVA